jgi:enoyl-CoA hydratase/carnithine racemase
MAEHVTVAREGAVQIVRLNRPEKKNALTAAMYAALGDALRAAREDADIGATLVLGHPGIFCAGNDMADFLAASQGGGMLAAYALIEALAEHDKPLLAAVDGPAIGIGTTLMFHCDLVFASERAAFHTPFTDLGLLPEAGSSLLGPRTMGHARAFELLVAGAPFGAERAKEAGIVNHIVASEELEAAARASAEAIAKKPREAVRMAKRLLRGDPAPLKARMQEEGALFLERVRSDEARQAFMAFLQKSAR